MLFSCCNLHLQNTKPICFTKCISILYVRSIIFVSLLHTFTYPTLRISTKYIQHLGLEYVVGMFRLCIYIIFYFVFVGICEKLIMLFPNKKYYFLSLSRCSPRCRRWLTKMVHDRLHHYPQRRHLLPSSIWSVRF